MYLLMAFWFAIHASVTAKMYNVRLLTQNVRLPMPNWTSLEGARTYGSCFEKMEAKQMFRVPFAMGSQAGVLQSSEKDRKPSYGGEGKEQGQQTTYLSADTWGLEGRGDSIYELDGAKKNDPNRLRHLELVRAALPHWQSYDGFARAAMSVGTTHLTHALSYYVLGYVLLANHCVFSAWLVVILLMAVCIHIIRLDMSLSRAEFVFVIILMVTGPTIIGFACERHMLNGFEDTAAVRTVTPLACVAHALYLAFLIHVCRVSTHHGRHEIYLPLGFRSVMYIDVFGWMHQSMQTEKTLVSKLEAGSSRPAGGDNTEEAASGYGPAVESVRYDQGIPQPVRPETLPGAAQCLENQPLRQDAFDDSSFVPGPEEDDEGGNVSMHSTPGKTPSRIFYGTTYLLIVMWIVVGASVFLEGLGLSYFVVQELLDAPEDESAEAQDGELVVPSWSELRGESLRTFWPRGGGHPHSMACGLREGDETAWVVASSDLKMFTAKVGLSKQTEEQTAHFKPAPPCADAQGMPIQDLAVQCNANEPCRALVLPKAGHHLATCDISVDEKARPNAMVEKRSSPWLGERESADSDELITSIAVTGKCNGTSASQKDAKPCAYLATNSGRIVEMRDGEVETEIEGNTLGESDDDSVGQPFAWLPARSMRLGVEANGDTPRSLVVVGEHLLVFQPHERMISWLDTDTGGGGRQNSWRLPPGHQWSAVCGAGDSLFVVAGGPVPKLWRFGLPVELLRPRGTKAATSLHKQLETAGQQKQSDVTIAKDSPASEGLPQPSSSSTGSSGRQSASFLQGRAGHDKGIHHKHAKTMADVKDVKAKSM